MSGADLEIGDFRRLGSVSGLSQHQSVDNRLLQHRVSNCQKLLGHANSVQQRLCAGTKFRAIGRTGEHQRELTSHLGSRGRAGRVWTEECDHLLACVSPHDTARGLWCPCSSQLQQAGKGIRAILGLGFRRSLCNLYRTHISDFVFKSQNRNWGYFYPLHLSFENDWTNSRWPNRYFGQNTITDAYLCLSLSGQSVQAILQFYPVMEF